LNNIGCRKKTIKDINVDHKKVLVRVDYNVAIDKKQNITDDTRIRASLPTLHYLLEHNAKIILCSHLDRPDGKVVESMRLFPVADHLAKLLDKPVIALEECVGTEVENAVSIIQEGQIILLENLRFHKEEESNDPSFAASLAKIADIYVNDAFGASHREHASIVGIPKYLPSVAGFLMEKELNFLGYLLTNPVHPFIVIVGGAKTSDKLGIIQNILDKVDVLLIGGGMVATFLKTRGYDVGASVVEYDKLDVIKRIFDKADFDNVRLILPHDVLVSQNAGSANSKYQVVPVANIPEDTIIVDIGPDSVRQFSEEIQMSKTVFWNGPMGIFEIDDCSNGTKNVAKAVVENAVVSVLGGGSTAEAVEKFGLKENITHVSTGGGASLEFLAGHVLPGIAAIKNKIF